MDYGPTTFVSERQVFTSLALNLCSHLLQLLRFGKHELTNSTEGDSVGSDQSLRDLLSQTIDPIQRKDGSKR